MNPKEKSRFDILYQKHLDTLALQGKADKTIDAYARAVRRLANFVERCPDDVSTDELKNHFSQLIKSHSWSTIKLDLNGLRFFFRHILKRDLPWLDIVKPPRVQTLPDILTAEELAMLILHTTDFRFQAFWFVTYSTGLRLSEALNLTISDIDRRRMTLHIRRAKGRKDRFVTMPRMTLAVLQKLWLSHRHASLLFPSNQPKKALQTLHRGTLQRTFRRVCLLCGIHKHVSIHSLRHSYATHLMEAGLNLQSLQIQLGHSEPQTTAKYVRLTEKSQHNSAELINRTIDQLVSALHGQKASS